MSDDETRREDARIEAAIDHNLKHGTMGFCCWCGDPTHEREENEENDNYGRWLCKSCKRAIYETSMD